MRTGVLSALALCACGYPPLANPRDAPEPDGAIDDAGAGDAAVSAFCDPSDARLVACYEFEGNGMDGSPHHMDATTSNVVFAPGRVGMAVQLGPTTAIDVGNRPELDVSAVTLEAWVRPSQLPVGVHAYGTDVDAQYGWYIDTDGSVHCSFVGGIDASTSGGAPLELNRWAHVACTYESGKGSAVYIDGDLAEANSDGGVLAKDGTTGISIGRGNNGDGTDRLIGLIDQVRVMNSALSAAEICADAGKSSCATARVAPPPPRR